MSRAPRIGIVCPRYAPAIGGVERHVEMLARRLIAHGIAVEVITTDPSAQLPPFEVRDGVVVRRFPTVAHDAVFFVAPQLKWWLLRNAQRYALLHAHSYHTPLAAVAAAAARRARLPFVLTPHYHGTGHSAFRVWLHRPYRPIGAWLFRAARSVICVSRVEQRMIEDHFGTHIRTAVIPNGIDLDRLASSSVLHRRTSDQQVLSVGRLDHYKQTDLIVQALPYLPRTFRMKIIGDGPARPSLEHLVPQPSHRLRLPGQVPETDLAAAYRDADVFVTMSREEAFGMTVLEAAAAGVPVVASDIPAHREVAGYIAPGRVLFVERGCPPMALAQAIRSAAALGRADSVAHDGLPTWDSATDALLDVYATAGVRPAHRDAARIAS
jgi:glycosyltransferase involved in cell wall biosynthesis